MSYFITEKCIGCTLCKKLCPVGAVEGTLKERHRINEKRCVECGVCGRACGQGAILDQAGNQAEQVPKSKWKKPVILREKCSACSMCVWNCTKDALKIADPSYRGDLSVFAELAAPERCVGCGICESACPLHAIYMKAGEAE